MKSKGKEKKEASKESRGTSISKPGSLPQPRKKWQVGDYARHTSFRFVLPYEFILVCKLLEIKPEDVLNDFMLSVSCGSWKREGRQSSINRAIEYMLSCGYGQSYYTEELTRAMFSELDSIGKLWPTGAKMKMIDLHAKWRNKYLDYWFKKWYRKPRRAG